MATCSGPFPSTSNHTFFFHLLRSSVITHNISKHHRRSQGGFPRPSFNGAVGHEMTDITRREARAIPVFYQFFGFAFFKLASKQKRGQSVTLKERHGIWINGFIYFLLPPACLLFLVGGGSRVQSFFYLASHSRVVVVAAAAGECHCHGC